MIEIRHFLCHLPLIRRNSQHFYVFPSFWTVPNAMLLRRNTIIQSVPNYALETLQAQFTSFNDDLAGLQIVRDKDLAHTRN